MMGPLFAILNGQKDKQAGESKKRLENLGMMLQLYTGENEGKFPDIDGAAGLNKLVPDYVNKLSDFKSPFDTKRKVPAGGAGLLENNCSYLYLGAGYTDTTKNASNLPLIISKSGVLKGATILYLDGHVEFIKGQYADELAIVTKVIDMKKLSEVESDMIKNKIKIIEK
ncbi:MAG: hypothetical protein HRT89_13620 [Lentisphaeria bacterium]|nr:hypothetical protein [Lentisphaeria bacterium]